MTSAAVLAPAGIPALSERDRRMYRGGIWLVIIAETMIFVTLFSTRFLIAGRGGPVGPGDPVGVGITVALILSLIPAGLGLHRMAGGEAVAMSRHLGLTAGLAVAVLAAIVVDWLTLSFPPGSPFGEIYIISTGYHAAHIVIGAIWLAAAAVAGRRGAYTRDNHWVVEAGVRFWCFVVAMWLGLYIVFFAL
jgi:cytochrome c oxidase subunit 3